MVRYYLRDTSVNVGTLPRLTASTALPVHTAPDSSGSPKDLSTTIGTGSARQGPPGAAQTAAQDVFILKWVSPQLQAGAFRNPTAWTFAWALDVENAGQTAWCMTSLYVVKADDSVRGYISDAHCLRGNLPWAVSVPGTSPIGRVFPVDGDPVQGVAATDRLVLEVWSHTTQSAPTGWNHRVEYDGTVIPTEGLDTGNDAASYIEYEDDDIFSRQAMVVR